MIDKISKQSFRWKVSNSFWNKLFQSGGQRQKIAAFPSKTNNDIWVTKNLLHPDHTKLICTPIFTIIKIETTNAL